MGVSKVPCGVNSVLYLSEMSTTVDAGALNAAGAKYRTGYCDAQCQVNNFVKCVVSTVSSTPTTLPAIYL